MPDPLSPRLMLLAESNLQYWPLPLTRTLLFFISESKNFGD